MTQLKIDASTALGAEDRETLEGDAARDPIELPHGVENAMFVVCEQSGQCRVDGLSQVVFDMRRAREHGGTAVGFQAEQGHATAVGRAFGLQPAEQG